MKGSLMKSHARRFPLLTAALLASIWFVPAPGARAQNQVPPNTLTVENKSGDPVHAELIGPSAQALELADNESRTVNVAPGEYTMRIRYGTDPKAYSYSKVAPFKVEQTSTTYMAATVTIDCSALRSPQPIP